VPGGRSKTPATGKGAIGLPLRVASRGKLYLASVLDMASRRIAGFALGEHHGAELARGSLTMAAAIRGCDVKGLIFQFGQGSEGGFNRSSQHLVMMEVFDGSWRQAVAGGAGGIEAAVGGGPGVACADAFAGAA